ncbi:MAG: hypothetical protein ACI4VP_01765 [Clostridia bacterium]
MEQRSLRVVETNKTFFSKITNSISKLLVPTRIGLNSMIISMKRNSLIKAYMNYISIQNETDEEKKGLASKKYEDAYSLYLESIDKNIMDNLYKKVKNGIANDFEKEALAKYYFVVSLKDKHYLEYKYKKQEYLLKIDYETASNMKKENLLKTYKEFYVSKMDSLYKGLLKNYSVELTDNNKKDMPSEKTFDKIFGTLEAYVSEILPIKISLKDENKKYQEEYDKYEEVAIGKLNEQEKILKNMVLIGISRKFFTHSLPLGATEECYNWLIEQMRYIITMETNKKKQEKAYETLIKIIEDYNLKLLSTKVYWDNPIEKEQYKIFWNKYNEIQKIENEEEKQKQKTILFLKDDLKKIYKNKRKNKKILNIYTNYLVELGAMRVLKNSCKTSTYVLKGEKRVWNMQK